MSLAIITAHAGADSLEEAVASWVGKRPNSISDLVRNGTAIQEWLVESQPSVYMVGGQSGMLAAYEKGRHLGSADILAYLHDDLILKEPGWVDRVLCEFESPDVGLVGFCGALVHGSPELYKVRYDYRQLGRSYVLSNAVDAETHGTRFTGSNDVATLDGLALIFRREVLEKAGGWPVDKIQFHCYDYWATCITHRFGYRVRVVGCAYHHLGGRTSVDRKMDDGLNHEPAHKWIAQEFSDVLPWSCLP